jgi:hypothetical protein
MQYRVMLSGTLFALLLVFAGSVQAGPGTWTNTGSLTTARDGGHTATLLENGLVLIVGGENVSGVALAAAELYNPSTGTFSATGSLNTPRSAHTATLLDNGTVLIAGGSNTSGYLASAELYNPSTGLFTTVTGSLNTARSTHTGTLLSNGMVLIAGGQNSSSGWLASAELYNPSTQLFTTVGNLNTARRSHTATGLNNGQVLIVGGYGAEQVGGPGQLGSAELYNPSNETFALTGSLNQARYYHTATLRNDGKVLIAGGEINIPSVTVESSTEVYNPASGTFAQTAGLATARAGHTATLLNNGTVLIAGGFDFVTVPPHMRSVQPLASAELYAPSTESSSSTGSLNVADGNSTAVLLIDGNCLIAGGSPGDSAAELYQPTSLTPSGLTSISLSPANQSIPVGAVLTLTATGQFSGGPETVASAAWTSSNISFATVSSDQGNYGTVIALAAGTVTIQACAGSICGSTTVQIDPHESVMLGSEYTDGSSSTYEIRDDSVNLLGSGTLANPLANHTATLLQNGNIFVAGGSFDSTLWEIFSVVNGHLNVVTSGLLQDGRDFSFATRLANGNVLIGGGAISPGTLEIYSPTGALISTASLNGARTAGASAVLLNNGNVWISGSKLGNSDACTWEIHGPTGALVNSGSLTTCFAGGKVQVLSNGNVLLAGGDNAPGALEIYTQTGTYVRTGSMINGFNHGSTAIALNSGSQMLIFGSCQSGLDNPGDPNYTPTCPSIGAIATWEVLGFDANSNTTSDTTGSLFDSRSSARAIVTSSGDILITGGQYAPETWEMWVRSGTTITFVNQGGLSDTRYAGHSVTHQ